MNAKKITYQGRTQSVTTWARELGISPSTLASRLDKLGMSPEEALSKPVDARFQPIPAEVVRVVPPPKLRKDERGRAIARWSEAGRRICKIFGLWSDPKSRVEYTRWAAEWMANQGRSLQDSPAEQISVAGLILRAVEWADGYYLKHGKRTSEAYRVRAALQMVNELYGDTLAKDFGPVQLRAVRQRWVNEGLSIKTCNGYLDAVVRVWSYGVGRGLFPAAVVHALQHVERLVPGRTTAAMPAPVMSAPAADIEAILSHLHQDPERNRTLSAIVRIQRLTGMRPGELLELRPEDVDCAHLPWCYRPPSGGKTLHLEKARRVFIGTKARELLTPFLRAAKPGQLVFRVKARRGEGEVGISGTYYRQWIADACKRVGVPVFKPNQIRHTRATELDELGVPASEIAASLGNSAEVVERVYIDSPGTRAAKRVAEEHG